jgi:hypothetical protein
MEATADRGRNRVKVLAPGQRKLLFDFFNTYNNGLIHPNFRFL